MYNDNVGIAIALLYVLLLLLLDCCSTVARLLVFAVYVYLFDTRYASQPRFVECRAHIYTWQIWRRTFDTVRYSAG